MYANLVAKYSYLFRFAFVLQGFISGVWQHKQTGKCINFHYSPSWCNSFAGASADCRTAGYLGDDCTRMSTLSNRRFIQDQATGKYYCQVAHPRTGSLRYLVWPSFLIPIGAQKTIFVTNTPAMTSIDMQKYIFMC